MITLCTLATLSTLTSAEPLPLWAGELAPGDQPGTFGPEDHSFPYPDDMHITNVTVPTLTPFLIKDSTAATSAVVVAPGGGYTVNERASNR